MTSLLYNVLSNTADDGYASQRGRPCTECMTGHVVTILNKKYDVNTKELDLSNNKINLNKQNKESKGIFNSIKKLLECCKE